MRRAAFPLILILVGLVFLAHNLGYLPFGPLRQFLATWWPLILIIVGVAGLLGRR